MSSRFYLYLLVLYVISLLIPPSIHANNPLPRKKHVALMIFRDSLFDAGNNNYLKNAIGRANFWPYGETFFEYPIGRFSNGRLIPDFIAEYLKMPLILPYLQPGNHRFTNGINFASGGAGALIETHQGRVIELKTQAIYLKSGKEQIKRQVGNAETSKLMANALYIFSIGANDCMAPSCKFQFFTKEDYVEMVIGNVTSVIKEIYKIGGRKFVFTSMGAFDCSPSMRLLAKDRGGCNKEVTAQVKLHNKKLLVIFKKLKIHLKEFKYLYFDFYTSFSKRINHLEKYEKIDSSCGLLKGYEACKNVSEYLFFDPAHPSEKANKHVAKLLWSGPGKVNRPYNLKTLVEA